MSGRAAFTSVCLGLLHVQEWAFDELIDKDTSSGGEGNTYEALHLWHTIEKSIDS